MSTTPTRSSLDFGSKRKDSGNKKKKTLLFARALASFALCLFTLSPFIHSASAQGLKGDLRINTMHADPTPKKAFDALLTKFKAENPELKVELNTIDHESYKVQMRTWLPNNPPDVATWFAGNRARFFVEKGLIEPIDDVWKPVEGDFGEGAKKSVTYNGKKFLMPMSYYHWGFFYRKDLFAKAGIKGEPQNWTEFLDAVKKLKTLGVTPITIGTKQAWPAAAWFDFLDMRLNGFDFHMALLSGKEKYTDPRVKKAFELLGELVKMEAFPKNAPAMTWQEAAALFWQSKSALYLMGNFMSSEIPASEKGKIGFFGFPVVDPKQPLSQVAPTDVYFVPAKAKNKANGKAFLAFLARAENQELSNSITGLLTPNTKAKIDASNEFAQKGLALLSSAQGLSQFFDRDAEPEVAKVGMDGLVEFMGHPERIDAVLKKIEAARARVHKN